ncbi:MAG: polyprenyl synthetase family protein [Lachnospiraceae bacterium]|nr:polyprenyl synthetase family protein [Lachnospiraceae bacterium]
MTFNEQLNEKVEYVTSAIYEFAPVAEDYLKDITEAMNYSFKAGGKRLRPLIMFETFKMFGGKSKDIHSFMAAIEMIHTYSLIHDDLPAMDNDDYRRGKLTNHKMFGENIAILAGDALLNYAFELMSDAVVNGDDVLNNARAMKVIANKAGIFGMIGGQTIDVKTEGTPIDEKTLMTIHNLKTAALIEASMMAGAIIAGASEEEIVKVEKIAQNIGLAFQIQDDILDVTSSSEVLGKPVLSDEKNNKTTYITLKGLEESKKAVKAYSDEGMSLIKELNKDSEFLEELFGYLIYREK